MCQGGQGNFNMQRPGFTPGGANDPAQGGSGYTMGGSATWGGNYGNQINPGVGTGYQNLLPSMGSGHPSSWNVPYSGPSIGTGYQNYLPSMGDGNPWNWNVPYNGPALGVGGQGNPPGVQQVTHTTPAADPYAGIDAGRLAQAQRFADAGMFGRAKQQIGLGGGNWGDVGGLLRQEAKSDPYVKGSSMGFDWGDATAGRLAKAKELAAAGKMGQAKQMYERGGGKWSPGMHSQFKAWQKANT